MASNKWKPLYEFEASFFTQIGLCLGLVLSFVLIWGGGALISVGIMSSNVPPYVAGAFVLTVGAVCCI